jgi:NTP pyrophosphatase (non-canonical NTP hydrolase)
MNTTRPKIIDLQNKILDWAIEKNITNPENAKSQLLKSFEEMGELASALLKNETENIKDSIGDVLVTLIILAETQGMNIEQCLQFAWDEIKHRKGITVNGTFIKE